MRIDIPFCGPTYKSEVPFLTYQECINFYLRPYGEKMVLLGTPGLEEWVDLLVGDEVRGILPFGDYLYIVNKDKFQKVDSGGNITDIGDVDLLRSSGQVGMATNGVDIVMVAGVDGYVYDFATETLVQIVDVDFPGGDNIVQIDGYYLVNNPGTGQIYRSDINDGSSWDGLAFSTAGGDPDYIISIITDHRDVWIIGEYTTEIWYNTGAPIFNFARIEGAFIDQGGTTHHSRTRINNAVYWLGQDYNGNMQVFQAAGRQPIVISTPAISHQISQCVLSDVFMFSYQQLSHNFIVITFPTSKLTLVYDSTTSMWHERSSLVGGVDHRWRANCQALFKGEIIVGGFNDHKLYKVKTDVYTDGDSEMISTRTTGVIRESQNRITVDEVHLLAEPAVGLIVGEDAEDVDPMAMFSWSKDGGRTFSAEVDIPLGKIGEYENRARITQLGQGVNWVFRVRISAAVRRAILGAVMVVEKDDG